MGLSTTKLIQATAVLLRDEHCRQMSYLRLLKLLYIAERESLAATGRPIIGDRVVAMDKGPVFSNVLNIIKGQDFRSPEWDRFVHKDTYHLDLVGDPGIGQLSPFEIAKLKEVSARFAQQDDWTIVEHTHGFPEWKKNYVPSSSSTIPVEDILAAMGCGDETPKIMAQLAEEDALDKFLNRLGA